MAEARSIEGLSVTFTAGVAAGACLSGLFPWGFPGLLLPLIGLPLLLRDALSRADKHLTTKLFLGLFLLLGLFCYLSASAPSVRGPLPWERWAEEAACALRQTIDAIPFQNEGSAPLVKALLTGDRSGLSPEVVAAFRRSGASHILALSGLHIGILYLMADRLTRLAGRSRPVRYLRFGLIVSAAGFFTLMTGAGPSIVRAFLFIVIREIQALGGRPGKPVRVLCLALLVQLVLDPGVITSTGFQLSYLAMAGIFLLYPVLESWYPRSFRWDPVRKIWSLAALSISCQLFTGPLAWLRFHSFPRHFLLTNLLALPLTTGVMTAAIATVVLWSLGICPDGWVRLTDSLCRLLTQTLAIIAGL